MTYVLDTNIISKLLKGNAIIQGRIKQAILNGETIFINGISYYEIKRGLLDSNATKQLNQFEEFCRKFGLVLLDVKEIFDKAAELYARLKRQGKLIPDADILIASVVCHRNFVLVSDDSDFERVQELTVNNWLG